MAGDVATSRTPLIVGVNHRTGSLTLRDKLFVEDAGVPGFLDRLRSHGIDQALVLSTCDRVEVIAASCDTGGDAQYIGETFSDHAGLSKDEVLHAMTSVTGTEAVRHLFRVAASLDSVIVGEPQVLGQLKACHRLARDQGMASGDLDRLMQSAYRTAKRVRTETAIGERPVSIAAVAVGIAREVHGRLEDARALLLGGGDMGELIAEELLKGGLGLLTYCDFGRPAADVVARLGAHPIEMTGVTDALADADVVIAAIGGRTQALSADMVRLALKTRKSRPQFIVDASLPRDVETAVDRLDDAFLYDLADLERLAMEGQASRSFEAESAEYIVVAEVDGYLKGRVDRTAASAIGALHNHAATLRESVLKEAGGDADRATHLLMQRLLHAPSERLRVMAQSGADIEAVERLIRDLFGIAEDGDDQS